MATPKSFGVGGGNGHSYRQPIQGIPRREMQDELRGIVGEPGPEGQLDPRAQPAKPAEQARQEPPVRRAGPQRRIIRMPPSQPKAAPEPNGSPAPVEADETDAPAVAAAPEREKAPAGDGPVEFVVTFTRDEIPSSLERTLRFLEDRELSEIVERVVRAYFSDRMNDPAVRSAMEAWEQYGPVAE